MKQKELLQLLSVIFLAAITPCSSVCEAVPELLGSIFLSVPSDGSFFGHYRRDFSDGARAATSHTLVPDPGDPASAPDPAPDLPPVPALTMTSAHRYPTLVD